MPLIQQRYNAAYQLTAQVSPIRDLNIDINLDRTFDKNYSELYKDTTGPAGLAAVESLCNRKLQHELYFLSNPLRKF